ncbi:hypothetical protein BHYA_0079g00160 [Botrytis hyacinthi]|uniref:Uncharacterized protein n=1 Tax=Botrytis hyacinthi TaxID=278943 RepID=A0A4Z1GMV2_9HELO|nr:hypothetical protein BHYA_0079g00160 [Botrytis hyacinthi]
MRDTFGAIDDHLIESGTRNISHAELALAGIEFNGLEFWFTASSLGISSVQPSFDLTVGVRNLCTSLDISNLGTWILKGTHDPVSTPAFSRHDFEATHIKTTRIFAHGD